MSLVFEEMRKAVKIMFFNADKYNWDEQSFFRFSLPNFCSIVGSIQMIETYFFKDTNLGENTSLRIFCSI